MPLQAFRRQPDPVYAAPWFATPAGQAVLASEAECLAQAVCGRPAQAGIWFAPDAAGTDGLDDPMLLRLRWSAQGFQGDLRCSLPLPLANESCGLVAVQHLADATADTAALLEECARVLIPGGWLWLLALNPLSPYRWRWRGSGLRALEPVTWRRRMRAVGLAPDPVSRGLGPVWKISADQAQHGAGLRAAFLIRAEKRRFPVTPARVPKAVGWQAGTA